MGRLLPGLLADVVISVALYFGLLWVQKAAEERHDRVYSWATFELRRRPMHSEGIIMCTLGMPTFSELMRYEEPEPDSLKKKRPAAPRVGEVVRR
jgi:hypothetical protein